MIDPTNTFAVSIKGDRYLIMLPPSMSDDGMMSADEAINLAAWLVAVAEPRATHPFADVLSAVQNT